MWCRVHGADKMPPSENSEKAGPPSTSDHKGGKAKHVFWDTQPVLPLDQGIHRPLSIDFATIDDGPIEAAPTLRSSPYSLPPEFCWEDVDIDRPEHLADLHELLSENYVEDYDSSFRLCYPIDFLQW